LDDLRQHPEAAREVYELGVKTGDFSKAHATVGEAVGLIHDIPPAADLIARMTAEAEQLLGRGPRNKNGT
jgi:nitronate monooxygenase